MQVHRNNRFYAFLLQVCRFLYDNLLIDEETGQDKFREFIRDEAKMRAVFEQFVLNFYKHEQRYLR